MIESQLLKTAPHPYPGKPIIIEGIEEFDKMAMEFGFTVVDARQSPEEIQDELRGYILPVLQNHTPTVSTEAMPS